MGKTRFSLVANSVIELNVPEHILSQRMQRVGNHVKGFEMVKNGVYKYNFSSPERYHDHEYIGAQSIYLTSGSIIPLGGNRCRLAVNTDSRLFIIIYPFLAVMVSGFYYAILDKEFTMDWELLIPLLGSFLLVFVMIIFAGFKSQGFHNKIVNLAKRIEKQYEAEPPIIT